MQNALASGHGMNQLRMLPIATSPDLQIEYGQKLRHYAPALKEKGVGRIMVVINGLPASCAKLAELLDLPPEIELFSDPGGKLLTWRPHLRLIYRREYRGCR